ncbi:MAG: L-seryl-tRNA(Sec) selenium transferase, partial [Plesiomonas sp.]
MSHLPVTDAEPSRALYRRIPAIEQLLRHPQIQPLLAHYGNTLITEQLRQLQQQARQHMQTRHSLPKWSDDWPQALQHQLQQRRLAPPRVFNLTGTVLHTNLGRSPMAEAAVTAVSQVMRHPAALEFDLDASARGHRDQQVAQLLCRLTGAEDACIVNNNAAAVLLLLASMAAGQEVVVSR